MSELSPPGTPGESAPPPIDEPLTDGPPDTGPETVYLDGALQVPPNDNTPLPPYISVGSAEAPTRPSRRSRGGQLPHVTTRRGGVRRQADPAAETPGTPGVREPARQDPGPTTEGEEPAAPASSGATPVELGEWPKVRASAWTPKENVAVGARTSDPDATVDVTALNEAGKTDRERLKRPGRVALAVATGAVALAAVLGTVVGIVSAKKSDNSTVLEMPEKLGSVIATMEPNNPLPEGQEVAGEIVLKDGTKVTYRQGQVVEPKEEEPPK